MVISTAGVIAFLALGATRAVAQDGDVGVMLAIHQISWSGYEQDCDPLSLGIEITCPVLAKLLSDYDVCSEDSQTTVKCASHPGAAVKVGCYGSVVQELKVQVTVPESTYQCSGNDGLVVTECPRVISGAASVTASAFTVCQGLRLSPPELSCSETATLSHTAGGGSYCTAMQACSSDYNCCDSLEACSDSDHCIITMNSFSFTAALRSETLASCIQEFPTTVEEGQECLLDASCISGLCISGKCVGGPVAAMEQCQHSRHCSTGSCALMFVTENLATNTNVKICCPTNNTVTQNTSTYCGNIDVGGQCGGNEMCRSGECVDGVCLGVRPGSQCRDGNDCLTGSCGYNTFASDRTSICCEVNSAYEFSNEIFCGQRPVGTMCMANPEICASGRCIDSVCASKAMIFEHCSVDTDCESGMCGYSSFATDKKSLCCKENVTVAVDGETYCGERPTGTICNETNLICASGLCIDGRCLDKAKAASEPCAEDVDCLSGACALDSANGNSMCCETNKTVSVDGSYFCAQKPSGSHCGSLDSLCASGICIDNICVDQALATSEPCIKDGDCVSGKCGYSSFATNKTTICCYESLTASDGNTYCGGRPSGTICDENNLICESGFCIDGRCADQAKADFETCSEDADCLSGTCVSETVDTDHIKSVCCGENMTVVVDGRPVCAQRPNSMYCGGVDIVCASGICIDSMCASQKKALNDPCGKDTDCSTGTCAYISLARANQAICCDDSMMFTLDGKSYCGQRPAGTICGESNLMCASGMCVEGLCVDEAQKAYEPCSEDLDCLSGACGFGSVHPDNKTSVCCEKNMTVWVNGGPVCAHLPSGSYCGTDNGLCASTVCVDSVCVESERAYLDTCQEAADCISRTCAYDSFAEDRKSVCCNNTQTVTIGFETFCAERPAGTLCGDANEICASGICINSICAESTMDSGECKEDADCSLNACGLSSVHPENRTLVCCNNNITIVMENNTFCTNLPNGSYCGNFDAVCASNLCIDSICAEEENDYLEVCQEGADCKSRTCAYDSLADNRTSVCCNSTKVVTIGSESFCAEMPPGTFCGVVDEVCASGVCIGSICAESARESYEVCEEDEDCLSGACAFDSIDPVNRKVVCCKNNETVTIDEFPVCTELPSGSLCGNFDALCASMICIEGACADEGKTFLEPCLEGADCKSRACAYSSLAENRTNVCCNSTKTVTIGGASFCADMPSGTFCGEFDQICFSGVCIGSTCAASARESYEVCDEDSDCLSGACAFDSADLINGKVVCCEKNVTISLDGNHTACTNLPSGSYCGGVNALCASGICIDSLCADAKRTFLQTCQNGADCLSTTCAYDSPADNRTNICCNSTNTVIIGPNIFCAEMPTDTFCGDIDEVCASGVCIASTCAESARESYEVCEEDADCLSGACAFDSIDPVNRKVVCCENNATVSIDDSSFCTQIPSGSYCGNVDSVCASGLCIDSLCADEANEFLETCQVGADCKSQTCAFGSAADNRTNVCCNTTRTVTIGSNIFCADMPAGTFCGEIDAMCASQVCFNSTCAKSALDKNEECEEDEDCMTGACGFDSVDPINKKFVCCENNMTIYMDGSPFCTNLPSGGYCGNVDAVCASGLCIESTCSDEGKAFLQTCVEGPDCESLTCAYDSLANNRTNVCCNSKKTVTLESGTFCAKMPAGTFCGEVDEICASGVCIASRCAESALDSYEVCEDDSDCLSGACAFDSVDTDNGKIVCCQKNVTVAVNENPVCTNLPSGSYCGDIDSVCSSEKCIDSFCADDEKASLETCREPADCQSFTCALDSLADERTNVCCNSTQTVTVGPNIFCAEKPTGAFCGENVNEICTSGICINSTCAESALAVFDPCDEDSDCQSKACGYSSLDEQIMELLCCETNQKVEHLGKAYCTMRPIGTICGELDEMCASGLCIWAACVGNPKDVFEPCTEDSDCMTNRCVEGVCGF